MSKTTDSVRGSGISEALAVERSAGVRNLAIRLALSVSRDPEAPIRGRVRLSFELADGAGLPPLDFAPDRERGMATGRIRSLRLNGEEQDFAACDGHLGLTSITQARGRQDIDIEFEVPGSCLRWRDDLAYSLFVPAHAHELFPCMDQPDLRARLDLELEIPADWDALANTTPVARTVAGDRAVLRFRQTEPLPSYLFAFAAGRLQSIEASPGQRPLTMYFASPDSALIESNRQAIFELHARALEFLERYTGIPYPFERFACALIPDFEFGGMEHPGAVFYREQLLLLPPDAPESAILRRATLIAHETAHMWFGNLATIRWFDDVWLKEVFANFMADKIVAEMFPHLDHELGFMLRHFPPALAIDRTPGAHPIRRRLGNLAEAESLYDAVIYHKAPIALAALEREIGAPSLRAGLSAWLDAHRFENVDWPSLLTVLAMRTRKDLIAFSRRWIETPGAPLVDGREALARRPRYGRFELDEADRSRALETLADPGRTLARAQAWIALYEDMLAGGTSPARLLTAGVARLTEETDPLFIDRMLEDLSDTFWRFLPPGQRAIAAGPVERALNQRFNAAADAVARHFWLGQLAAFALTPELLAEVEDVWRHEGAQAGGLPEALDERLTYALAVKRPGHADDIVATRRARIRHPDGAARLDFLAGALSASASERQAFFADLLADKGRGLWRVTGLALLNHAVRADEAIGLIEPGLRHAAGIQARGELFLPRQWLLALFAGHGSPQAAEVVDSYLNSNGLEPRHRELVLQTADLTCRAARLRA